MSSRTATIDRTDKQEAILEAALVLFTERGFHGTAVPEVAERAGVGAGTIYRYFASKEALVNALYRKYKNGIAEYMLRDFPAQAPAREQFHVLWQRMMQFATVHPKAFAFLELHHHASYLDAESHATEARMVAFGVSLIESMQARRELKPLPPLLLIGIVTGAFIGILRKHWECGLELSDANIAASEQCTWEAIRV
jgi:TetR/AcrR family transcriptional regulator, repressor of fatR-cypB operon